MFKPLFNGFKIVGSEALASHESGEAKETVKVFALIPLFSKEGLGEFEFQNKTYSYQ